MTESVRRAQWTDFPNQLGPRTIDTDDEALKGLKDSKRFNPLLQLLHKQQWEEYCKTIQPGQQVPNLVPLENSAVDSQRLELRRLALRVKNDYIDKDFPAVSKVWKDIPPADRDYYMMRLEKFACDAGLKIYKCKRMWCAKALLRATFKSANQTKKRRDERVRI